MSSINSISDSQSLIEILKTSQENSTQGGALLPSPAPPPDSAPFEAKLSDALDAAGVDEETAAALKADLSAAFEQFQSSGQTDRASHKETMDAVFAKHGLDAKEILGHRAEQVSNGEIIPDEDAFSANLTALLEKLLSSDANGQTSTESLLNGLFGLDASA